MFCMERKYQTTLISTDDMSNQVLRHKKNSEPHPDYWYEKFAAACTPTDMDALSMSTT